MYIAMNRFKIQKDHADFFEKHWRKRESFLAEFPAFMRFRLLRSEQEDHAEFVSYTEWLCEGGFREWLDSAQIKKAHGNSTVPREAYMGPPEFRGYQMCLDEVPAARQEFRSSRMDSRAANALAHESEAQKKIWRGVQEKGMAKTQIGPSEGKLLELLAKLSRAQVAVEIGSLGGYSATWLLRGLSEDARLTCIEKDSEWAATTRSNLVESGDASRVTVREGDANALLEEFADQSVDLLFVDADKASYGAYLEHATRILRPGGLLVADDVFLFGALEYWDFSRQAFENTDDPNFASFSKEQLDGMSAAWKKLAVESEWSSCLVPAAKGLAVAIRR